MNILKMKNSLSKCCTLSCSLEAEKKEILTDDIEKLEAMISDYYSSSKRRLQTLPWFESQTTDNKPEQLLEHSMEDFDADTDVADYETSNCEGTFKLLTMAMDQVVLDNKYMREQISKCYDLVGAFGLATSSEDISVVVSKLCKESKEIAQEKEALLYELYNQSTDINKYQKSIASLENTIADLKKQATKKD